MDPPENFIMDLSLLTGSAFIGTFVATGLWGMTCMQTLMYFLTYESDAWYLKSLVILLWQLYQGIVACIVAFLARGFFTWRIWIFADKNWIFPLVLMPPTLGDTVITFVVELKAAGKPASFLMTRIIQELGLAPSIIIAITDTMIAVTMVVLLWRRRTGIPDTDKMIVRLMQFSVITGAWTAIFGLLSTITLATWPQYELTTLTQIPLCPLYCNSVLANLNSRKYISHTNVIDDVGKGPPPETISEPMQFGALSSRTNSGVNQDSANVVIDDDGIRPKDEQRATHEDRSS